MMDTRPALAPEGAASKAFLRFWRGLVEGFGRVPHRADIRPEDMLEIIDHVWLYERDGEDFRCRIMGNHVQPRWGRPVIGQCFAELMPKDRAALLAGRLMGALANSHVGHGFNDVSKSDRYAERVYGPLLDAAGRPVFVLGVSSYVERKLTVQGSPGSIPLGVTNFYDALSLEYRETVRDE